MDIFVLVLEDETKFQSEIFNALKKINPQVKIRFFISLEEFSNWISLFVKEGAAAIEMAGSRIEQDTEVENISSEKTVRMIVCKFEILGARSVSLIDKTIELFVRKNVSTAEERTSAVVTAFDHESFQLKPMETSFINNVIFKPFDSLILEEHLRHALIGRKKPADENFKSNKLETQIEMVKDIPCEGFSDLGFMTFSDRELRIGEINKFYSDEFSSGTLRSVMARCVKSAPRGQGAEGFRCWMEYFGIEGEQIKKFRKELINEFPSDHLNSTKKDFKKNFLILDSLGETDLGPSLKRFFPETSSFYYSKWETFSFDASPESSGLLAEKDIPIAHDFILRLDSTGHYLLEQDPKSEIELVFGETFGEIKKKDFQQLLDAESKKVWLEITKNQKVDLGKEPILVIENLVKKYMVRLTHYSKSQGPSGAMVVELRLSELTMVEKISYLKQLSPLPKTIDMIIASEDFMKLMIDNNLFPDAKRVLLVQKQLSDKEKRTWSKIVYDVFSLPVDKNYLVKKIYLSFLDKNLWWVKHFNKTQKEIQSAQQIQLDEVSEAGLAFKYHRPLAVGSFRRFYLWTPNETELRDYHANCNYFEEIKEGATTSYIHHFVFFGMKDFYLKNIRLWVRDSYILSKSKEG